MKRFLKLTAVFLCFLMIFSGLFACKKGENGEDPELSFSTEDIYLKENKYVIIHAETVNERISSACTDLFKRSKEKGFTFKNLDDEQVESEFEILIDDTNRAASKMAKEYLKNNSLGKPICWLIATVGKKIVIVGNNDNSVIAAIDHFVENYVEETVQGGIFKLYDSSEGFTEIEMFGSTSLKDVSLVRPIYNVSYITQTETDKLQSLINEKTGYYFPLINDSVASKGGNRSDGSATLTKSEEKEKEIVIGNCDRNGVRLDLGRDEYEIRIEENRIFLNGGSPYATAMAVTEFCKLVSENTQITPSLNVISGDYRAALATKDPKNYYKPTWCDNFDGPDINYELWNVRWGADSGYEVEPGEKPSKRGNLDYMNNYISGGCLYQAGIEDEEAYYGGMFDTKSLMNYRYGYIELSDIQPKGSGFWTALWNCSEPGTWDEHNEDFYFCEIDINECTDGSGTWTYGVAWAWPTSIGRKALGLLPEDKGTFNINGKKVCDDDRGYYLDFHTYGFEWSDNTKVSFTVDGYTKLEFDIDEPAIRTALLQPQYLRLSLATAAKGHKMSTDPTELTEYNKFIIDWVYIFQKSGQGIYKRTENRWQEYNWLDY